MSPTTWVIFPRATQRCISYPAIRQIVLKVIITHLQPFQHAYMVVNSVVLFRPVYECIDRFWFEVTGIKLHSDH